MKRYSDVFKILLFASVCLLMSCNKSDKKDEPVEPDKPDTNVYISDVCGNKYRVVTIGSQTWMAENLRCDTYDTQSVKAGDKVTAFAKADDRSLWDETSCSADLSDEQISSLGYLYSRSAALGIDNESEKLDMFTVYQGICPNGWHMPNDCEWISLCNHSREAKSINDYGKGAGKLLKSKTGWCSSSENYKAGADVYSFYALPAGVYDNKTHKTGYVGRLSTWISANNGSDFVGINIYTWQKVFNFSDDVNEFVLSEEFGLSEQFVYKYNYINTFASVRCVKDGSSWFYADIDPSGVYETKGDWNKVINVYINAPYTYTVESDKDWAKCSFSQYPDLVKRTIIRVKANTSEVTDEAHITMRSHSGETIKFVIKRNPVE